jgi:microcompartment protein CcmK/EutM
MILGRVIGTVWATRKDERLEGLKLQIVEQVGLDLKPAGAFVVAVDAVEAGVGEVVLVAQGSSARQTQATNNKAVDAVIMAIVENLDLADEKALARELDARRREVEQRLARQAEV